MNTNITQLDLFAAMAMHAYLVAREQQSMTGLRTPPQSVRNEDAIAEAAFTMAKAMVKKSSTP